MKMILARMATRIASDADVVAIIGGFSTGSAQNWRFGHVRPDAVKVVAALVLLEEGVGRGEQHLARLIVRRPLGWSLPLGTHFAFGPRGSTVSGRQTVTPA